MKICPYCNNQVNDDAAFCGMCGAKMNEQQAPVQQAPVQQAPVQQAPVQQVPVQQVPVQQAPVQQAPVQQVPVQQAYQPQQAVNYAPAPTPAKKGPAWWVILVIAVLVVSLLGGLGYVAYDQGWFDTSSSSRDKDDDDDKSENKNKDEDEDEDVSANTDANKKPVPTPDKGASGSAQVKYQYTTGEVDGDYYINNWANLKFRITSEWPQGTAAEYATYENATTDCGFLASDSDEGKQFVIGFENLLNTNCSESEYMSNLTTGLENTYTSAGLNYNISTPTYKTIAGQPYLMVKAHLTDADLYQNMYVRKVDNYMVFIVVTSFDLNEIDNTINSIQTAR